jgi:hypothetical protein
MNAGQITVQGTVQPTAPITIDAGPFRPFEAGLAFGLGRPRLGGLTDCCGGPRSCRTRIWQKLLHSFRPCECLLYAFACAEVSCATVREAVRTLLGETMTINVLPIT